MKKVLLYLIFVITAFFLQSTIFTIIDLGGLVPDCLLVVTVSIALIFGSTDGCIVGFFAGLLLDISFGSILGLFAMIFVLLGYFFGKFNRMYYKQDITLPLIIIALADTILNITTYVFLFLTRNRLNFSYYLFKLIIPGVFYTVIIGIFIYKLIQISTASLQKGGDKLYD